MLVLPCYKKHEYSAGGKECSRMYMVAQITLKVHYARVWYTNAHAKWK